MPKTTNISERLCELDLKDNEALVYTELLKLGTTKAGELVRSTRLHRQLVYNCLDSLSARKLVAVSKIGNVKHFAALHPSRLVDEIKEKEAKALKLVPQLLALTESAKDELSVFTLVGKEGMFANLRQLIDDAAAGDGIMRIIGGASANQFYNRIGEYYSEYVNYLEMAKVGKRLLSAAGVSKEFHENFVNEPNTELKTLQSGLSSPTYTRITSSMVSIEIYASQTLIVQIKSKDVATGYLEHFELLWTSASS